MPFLPGNQLSIGRPKANHTLKGEEMRRTLIQMVHKELKPILTGQIELAKGIWYESIGQDGTVRIYKDKPDVNASKYLLDQAVGKAKELVELSGGIALLVLDE